MASNLVEMASNQVAMASNLVAMASNLVAMASNLVAMASAKKGQYSSLACVWCDAPSRLAPRGVVLRTCDEAVLS